VTHIQRSWATGTRSRVLTEMDACRAALEDRRLTSDPHLAGLAPRPSRNLLHMEGARHTAIRRPVLQRLSRRAVDGMDARLGVMCEALATACRRRLRTDLVTDLIEPVVRAAVFDAFEIPVDARAGLSELLRGMAGILEPSPTAGDGARDADAAMVRAAAVFHRQAVRGSAVGLHAELLGLVESGAVRQEDVQFAMPVVLHGGYENPYNLLGLLAVRLSTDPSRFRRVTGQARADLIDREIVQANAVRGVVRWASVDLPERDVERGDALWLSLEDANRTAVSGRGLAFGWGRHACPGMELSRRLARHVVEAVLRWPDDVLAEAGTHEHAGVVSRGVTAFEL
jgi:cytochrome P450